MNNKLTTLVTIVALALTGCAVNNSTNQNQSTPTPTGAVISTPGNDGTNGSGIVTDSVTITISDMKFVDSVVTIKKGGTVTWFNSDLIGHSIVADDGSFTSRILSKGETFGHKYDTVGEFSFHCGLHPNMTGKIKVVD